MFAAASLAFEQGSGYRVEKDYYKLQKLKAKIVQSSIYLTTEVKSEMP